MNKLDMESKDIVRDNLEYIKERFPEAVTEENGKLKLNPDSLIQSLSSVIIDDKKEKYELTWPGKKQAIVEGNTRTTKTLRPLKDKSVDFDKTENIYIEGDNLEALKILQESYLNKIKCIYIDPPYNTGNDFIYNDNFNKTSQEELMDSGQLDDSGNRLIANVQSNGRFHSDWLSMMYPRLKLARNLLNEEGVLFISIDDNEVNNTIKICNEIFGERNFLLQITNISNPRGRQTTRLPFALMHEYILVYCKNIDRVELYGQKMDEKQLSEYKLEDENGKYRLLGLRKRGTASDRKDRPNLFYPIYYNLNNGHLSATEKEENSIEIYPKKEDLSDGVWRWQKSKVDTDKEQLIVKEVRRKSGEIEYDVFVKDYLNKYGDEERKAKLKSIFDDKKYNNERGTEVVKELFNGKKYFSFPKPVDTIEDLILFGAKDNDIILDFFSGSSTTAHAVLDINSKNDSNLRFIMIQLDEKISDDFEAKQDGYKTICDIAEERIRRASKKIKEETNADIDYGFRVYKIDDSNMKDEYYMTPDKVSQEQIRLFEDNIKEDRTPDDLITQVILNLGLKLDLPISEKNICGNKVFDVDDGELLACFDNNVSIDIIEEIAKINPRQVVFRDSSFATDQDKVNFEERLKRLSAGTKFNVL